MRSGEAFNVVPAHGELVCDLRADSLAAFEPVLAAVPDELGEVRVEPHIVRAWPGMDTRAATAGVLERAAARLGRPLVAAERGGASDARHMAGTRPHSGERVRARGGGRHH